MGTKWYYAENGERAGPETGEEIVKLVGRCDAQPVLIWTEGTAAGMDASQVAEWMAGEAFAAHPTEAQAKQPELKRPTLARRVRNEVIEYMAIAGYLAVCFGALLFFKAAILESEGVEATRVGLAIIKALILGKFVLILEKLRIGDGKKSANVLVLDVIKKALLFTALLLVLTAVEDVIVGFVHGESARDALRGIGGGTQPEALATALLMFLILIPYFAYREIAARLGEEALSKLLFTRQPQRRVSS